MIGINFLMKSALAKETKNIVEKSKTNKDKTKQSKQTNKQTGKIFLELNFEQENITFDFHLFYFFRLSFIYSCIFRALIYKII